MVKIFSFDIHEKSCEFLSNCETIDYPAVQPFTCGKNVNGGFISAAVRMRSFKHGMTITFFELLPSSYLYQFQFWWLYFSRSQWCLISELYHIIFLVKIGEDTKLAIKQRGREIKKLNFCCWWLFAEWCWSISLFLALLWSSMLLGWWRLCDTFETFTFKV